MKYIETEALVEYHAAAARLDVAPTTIMDWIERGWLEGARIGRRVMVTRRSLDRVMASGTHANMTQNTR